jgi:hypothetical protein
MQSHLLLRSLADVIHDVILQTAESCTSAGATEVSTFSSDLTSGAAREKLIADITASHGHIDVLVRPLSQKNHFLPTPL